MFKYFDKYLSKDKNDVEHYFDEFDKEVKSNSDRGIALISGSIIDNLLADLLKSFFIKKDNIEKQLLNPGQTLGTFDAKIKMAFYLGLISEDEYQNLSLIQKTRNRFAHQVINISFENEAIVNICSNFKIPKDSFIPSFIPLYKEGSDEIPPVDLNPIKKETSAKDRFIFTSKYIIQKLIYRINGEELDSREEYIKEIKAHESIMLVPNRMMTNLYKMKSRNEELKERAEVQKEIIEEEKKDLVKIKDDKKQEEEAAKLEAQIKEVTDLLKEINIKIEDSKERIEDYQEVYQMMKLMSTVLENSTE